MKFLFEFHLKKVWKVKRYLSGSKAITAVITGSVADHFMHCTYLSLKYLPSLQRLKKEKKKKWRKVGQLLTQFYVTKESAQKFVGRISQPIWMLYQLIDAFIAYIDY